MAIVSFMMFVSDETFVPPPLIVDKTFKMLVGEPNNARGKQSCLAIVKQPGPFKFDDIDCYDIHAEQFICEHVSK